MTSWVFTAKSIEVDYFKYFYVLSRLILDSSFWRISKWEFAFEYMILMCCSYLVQNVIGFLSADCNRTCVRDRLQPYTTKSYKSCRPQKSDVSDLLVDNEHKLQILGFRTRWVRIFLALRTALFMEKYSRWIENKKNRECFLRWRLCTAKRKH